MKDIPKIKKSSRFVKFNCSLWKSSDGTWPMVQKFPAQKKQYRDKIR